MVQIINDALPEQTETILLLLSDSSGGAAVIPAQATILILDDDGMYTCSLTLKHMKVERVYVCKFKGLIV